MSVLAATLVLWIKNLSLDCISGGYSFCACRVTTTPNNKADAHTWKPAEESILNRKHVQIIPTSKCQEPGIYLLVMVQESHGWTMLAFGRTKYFLGDVVLTWKKKEEQIPIKPRHQVSPMQKQKWKCHGPWTQHGARCCSRPWDCSSTACPARLRTKF